MAQLVGDRQHPTPTRQITGMQIVNVGFDHLRGEGQLFGSGTVARRYGIGKLVDELLAIVQVAENILSLFQVGNHIRRRKGPGGFGDLQGVA